MKTGHTDITFVIDKSGSMQNIADDTIGGFNSFLKDQQSSEGTADITIHQFDHLFESSPTIDINLSKPLDRNSYVPRGNTALNDAVGRSINDTGKRLSEKSEHERAEKVVFVIITDGFENSSKEFTKSQIKQMVEHQEKNYKWTFVFLAANQDAVLTGATYGFKEDNSLSYMANHKGVTDSFEATSSNLKLARSSLGPEVIMAFSKEQKKKASDEIH